MDTMRTTHLFALVAALGITGVPPLSAQQSRAAAGSPDVVDLLILADPATPAASFTIHRIDPGAAETAAILDVNGDGRLDILAGDSWYQAPGWEKHTFREVPVSSGYVDAFSEFAFDVDGDGWTDVVTFAYFARHIAWYRNPGVEGREWVPTQIDEGFSTEFARLVDIDGDGNARELLPQTTSRTSPLSWYELVDGEWVKHPIAPASYPHGIGAGDVNGDGRTDVLTPAGWFEAPSDPRAGEWTLHTAWADLGLPEMGFMHVFDVNGDGLADVITSAAHDYGVFWLEQRPDGSWRWHQIDNEWSEAHPSVLADLNGDGQPDFVTAKRYMGRNANSPGANEPLGVYWYEFRRTDDGVVWTRHTISYDEGVGGGLQMSVVDVDGDGDPDIVAPGKTGLHLLENTTN